MEPKKSKKIGTEWAKTDTVETWRSFTPQDKKFYVANIKLRLQNSPTAELTTWLKNPELKDLKKLVMTGSSGPDHSGEAKAALALILAKQHEDIDTFKDDDWKKDWEKLAVLHGAVRELALSPKYGKYVKDWLKGTPRRGFKLLVLNCAPIKYVTLKGIREADSPEKVAVYGNLKPKHQLWLTTLRDIFNVKHLGDLEGPGGKRHIVEDV
jgi:hypothetical protein